MSVRVRVRNFQSIEDAEIVVDGFVAVTGPNNSGKTAFLRAIRALFTNAAPGPYLRHGAAFLSVEIDFGDAHVLWEKGWEKPGGKGKSINRYTVNGKTLHGAGRGVPPEVAELGVCEIPAGSHKIWPQIASQFGGALFLLNKSGATMAEALSDVERVGKLTQALRLSEKDRRSIQSEIKVRRSDLADAEQELSRFEGLDEAASKAAAVKVSREQAKRLGGDLQECLDLKVRFDEAKKAWANLEGFAYEAPSNASPDSLQKRLAELTPLLARLRDSEASYGALKGFSYAAPDPGKAPRIQKVLELCREYQKRLSHLTAEVERFSEAPPELSDIRYDSKAESELKEVRSLRDAYQELTEAQEDLGARSRQAELDLGAAEKEVTDLLVERGVCPVCNHQHSEACP